MLTLQSDKKILCIPKRIVMIYITQGLFYLDEPKNRYLTDFLLFLKVSKYIKSKYIANDTH